MRICLVALLIATALHAQEEEEVAFSVAGRVVTTEGKKCAGAAVFLWDALAEDRPLAKGFTNDEGAFSLEVFYSAAARRDHPFGPVRVVAEATGRARVGQTVAVGTKTAKLIAPKPGKWEGVLTDAKGNALPGAPVRARHGDLAFATTTDEDGRFAFRNMGPGESFVTVSAAGHGSKRVHAASGERLVLALHRVPTETGRILDAETKQPIKGARLVALDTGTPVETVTDAQGRFAIEGTAGNKSAVAVYRSGYAVTKLVMHRGRKAESPDYKLEPAGSVSGEVVDEEGESVAFATVLLDPGFGAPIPARTDASGAFAFDFGVSGFAFVRVSRRGYLPARATVDANWRSDRVRVELERGRTVRGTVGPASKPEWGVAVRFLRRTRPTGLAAVATVYTNLAGEFTALAVPTSATLAQAGDGARRSAIVPVRDQHAFELKSVIALRGTLRDDAGAPIAGVKVKATHRDKTSEVSTNADGRFSFDVAANRVYRVEMASPGAYRAETIDVAAGDDVTLAVERKLGPHTLKVEIPAEWSGYAEVLVKRGTMVRSRWLRSGEQEVRFEHLDSEPCTIEVDATGYLKTTQTVGRLVAAMETVAVNLQRAGTLTLKATPGARVVVQTLSGEPSPVVSQRLVKGAATFGGFGPGRYRFIARAPQEIIVIREVEVGPRDAPRELDLTGGAAASLVVTVTDADGKPIQGAAIDLHTEGGFVFRTGKRTDEQGKARVDRLILGPLTVVARFGDSRADKGIRIRAGAEQAISLEIR
ncbi:MAG: carboxypeptidase regulatory-like domain-containing protein [Planctomycetota bacterium]|jgi:protocatechuate 3,4-dioxygenase beta subunit